MPKYNINSWVDLAASQWFHYAHRIQKSLPIGFDKLDSSWVFPRVAWKWDSFCSSCKLLLISYRVYLGVLSRHWRYFRQSWCCRQGSGQRRSQLMQRLWLIYTRRAKCLRNSQSSWSCRPSNSWRSIILAKEGWAQWGQCSIALSRPSFSLYL